MKACRYENLLLVGTLAAFAVWLVGKIAELKSEMFYLLSIWVVGF